MSNIGNKETMAKNLEYYVDKSGKTQKEICEDLHFSRSTFNEWVKGRKYPRIDKIEMLANYFGILKSDLIEDKETIDMVAEMQKDVADYIDDQERVIKYFLGSHDFDSSISNNMKIIREARKMSIEEVSKEIGITVSNLETYESSDIKNVPVDILLKFANLFGIDVEDLIGIKYTSFGGSSVIIFSNNPDIIRSQKLWQETVGELQFTEEELHKLMDYAKLLVAAREKDNGK